MIKNTKGNKSYTRPLPIRMLAILMAVVMVFSVVYINNSKGKVEAANVSDGQIVTDLITTTTGEGESATITYNPGNYIIYVPEGNTYSFTLPGADSMKSTEDVTLYKNTSGDIYRFTPDTEYIDWDEIEATQTITYAWSGIESSSIAAGQTAIATQKITYTTAVTNPENPTTLITEDITAKVADCPSAQNITVNVVNQSPSTISKTVDGRTYSISDADATNRTNNSNASIAYYGNVEYQIITGTGESATTENIEGANGAALTNLNNRINSIKDGTYVIRKNIKDTSGSLLYTKDLDYVKNSILFNKATAVKMNGETAVGDAAQSTGSAGTFALSLENVEPNYSIDLNIYTDSDSPVISYSGIPTGITVTPGTTVDSGVDGYKTPYNITGNVSDLAGKDINAVFTIKESDAEGALSDTLNFEFTYLDSSPSISAQSVDTTNIQAGEYFYEETPQKYYFKDKNVTLSATGSVSGGATIAKYMLYKYDVTKDADDNDVITTTQTTDIASAETTISKDVELDSGINYYGFGIESSYGQVGGYNPSDTTLKKYLSLYYDDAAPTISYLELGQDIKKEETTIKSYSHKLDSVSTTDPNVFNTKVSSRSNAYLYFKLSDGDGSGINQITCDDSTVEIIGWSSDHDSTYKARITPQESNNNTDQTYTFTITDHVGNKTVIKATVAFFDDKIVSDYKVYKDGDPVTIYDILPDISFLKWHEDDIAKTGSERAFYVEYTVKASKEIGAYRIKYSSKTPTYSKDLTSLSSYDDDTTDEKYTIEDELDAEDHPTGYVIYTFRKKYDGESKALKELNFEFINKNNVKESLDDLTIVNIDSDKPNKSPVAAKVDDVDVDPNAWYKNLVINYTFTDDTNNASKPFSGIASVQDVQGAKETNPTVTDNGFTLTVNESGYDETTKTAIPTTVSFKLIDKVGNKSEKFEQEYKVDQQNPLTNLGITGIPVVEETVDTKIYNLTNIPTIAYNPSDKPSGIKNAKATISDGSEPKDLTIGSKSLSDYLTVSDAKIYTVDIQLEDEAGNVNHTSYRFRVDGEPPETNVQITTPDKPTKKIVPYYNKDVTVSISIKDTNIDESSLVVYDNDSDVSKSISWTGSGTSEMTASYTAKTNGPHTIKFVGKDLSKNNAKPNPEASVYFVIDKQSPVITTYLNDELYNDTKKFVSGSAKTHITVSGETEDTEDLNDEIVTVRKTTPTGVVTTEEKKGKGPYNFSDDGYYEIKYDVTDKAGNSDSKTIGFTVDNSKPVHNMYITTADPAKVARFNNTYSNKVGKFSGHSDQEEYTYGQYYNTDVSIDFSFFDYNIKSAQVTDNGSVLPVNWSFNGPYGKGSYTISSEGYHEIEISSTDKSDNTTTDSGSNQKLRFTIDKSSPTISTSLNGVRYSEGSGVRYFNTNGTIDVSVSDANIDGSDLNRINRMTVPGSSVSVSEASVGEGAETFSTEADYEVQYYAIDRAGNRSDTRTVMFRVDKTAPQLQVSNVGAVSTAGSQNVSFNVKEAFFSDMNNVTIKIYKRVEGRAEVLEKTIDFKPNSANDSTSYTFSEDAEYRIEFTAEDKCGNKSNTDYSFIKDGTAPLITLSGVSNYDKTDKNVELTVIIDEAFYSSNRVTLSGTRTDINGKSNAITFDSFVTNRSKISQLQQLFKEDGIYDITVTSTDKAGNSSSKGVHFTIDTTDPVIGDLSKYDGIRTNSFKWDTNLDDLVTDLTVCDIKVYMDGSLYDGTSDVEDGSHVLKIEATDELGHTTTKEVTFVIDSRGPNIIISNVEDGDNLLESTEVIVTVELDEDSLDTVMLNDKAIEIKDNQAKLTVNKKGKYTLSATAHDEAGNASSAEIKFTFGKQTNLLLIGIIAGILILLLLALLVVIKRRQKDQ